MAALTTRPRSLRAVGTGRADDEVGMRSPSANAGFAIAADATLGPHRCTDAMAPAETNRQQHTESHRELRETNEPSFRGHGEARTCGKNQLSARRSERERVVERGFGEEEKPRRPGLLSLG